jgi:hypothetical protein
MRQWTVWKKHWKRTRVKKRPVPWSMPISCFNAVDYFLLKLNKPYNPALKQGFILSGISDLPGHNNCKKMKSKTKMY